LEPRSESPGLSYSQIGGSILDYSKAASAAVRQLAFGGMALVWILRTEERRDITRGGLRIAETAYRLGVWRYAALWAFAAALAVDVAQYVFGTAINASASEQFELDRTLHQERQAFDRESDERCVEYKRRVVTAFECFFFAKILCVTAGCGLVVGSAIRDGLVSR